MDPAKRNADESGRTSSYASSSSKEEDEQRPVAATQSAPIPFSDMATSLSPVETEESSQASGDKAGSENGNSEQQKVEDISSQPIHENGSPETPGARRVSFLAGDRSKERPEAPLGSSMDDHPPLSSEQADIENGVVPNLTPNSGIYENNECATGLRYSSSTGSRNNYLESQTFSDTNYGTHMTNMTRRSGCRGSSLELRKLPVDILLKPDIDLFDDVSLEEERNLQEESGRRGLLQRTCLNSKFYLRSQMMLSFGIISAFTIFLVVIVCIAVTLTSGDLVKNKTRESFEVVSARFEGRMARFIAEDLTPKLILDDLVQILHEATRDRLAGYPEYSDDSQVPFFDILSQTNKYPVVGDPAPLDWQFTGNVNEENSQEHFQERWPLYTGYPKVSTASPVVYMQGACDPNETNSSHYAYFMDCTDDNNNIATGGVFAPSPTSEVVHRKASDLAPLLKALYEYNQDIRNIGVYFSNSGAGMTLTYPGLPLDTNIKYTSIGCDWAKAPNPYNKSRQILSDEDVQRCRASHLHVYDNPISSRLYTPMDRGWFRDLVLEHDKILTVGPYLDAWTENLWLMTAGKAMFDRVTNELIGCVSIDFRTDSIAEILMNSTVTENSHITVVHWDELGTVVASTAWNLSSSTRAARISDLNVGVTQQTYSDLYELVEYNVTTLDPMEVRHKYENFSDYNGGFRIRAYPMPPPPVEYDPSYRPYFLAVVSISQADIFERARTVEKEVNETVDYLVLLSILVGCVGFGLVMTALILVSYYITSPLRQMNDIAGRIIENFGGNDEKISVEELGGRPFLRTELSEILLQFRRMVLKFSGGAIANPAKIDILELDNQFRMFDEFEDLYLSRQEKGFKYTLECPAQASEANGDDEKGLSVTPARVHFGSNVISDNSLSQKDSVKSSDLFSSAEQKGCSSPLFQLIVVLIVLPLLLSTVTISVIVTTSVSHELPGMISDAKEGIVDLQTTALATFTKLRAGFVARSSERPIRDLHVLTRYTSWLVSGGLAINDAYPELMTGIEVCKTSPSIEECEFIQENYVCDCEWNDNSVMQCDNFQTDSRYLQVPFFYGSSQDTWRNGDRNFSSYPAVANSSSTTAWWENATMVPGAAQRSTKSLTTYGHATTYDRLRSVAALPVHQVLYNYDVGKKMAMNLLIGFEADGMLQGYRGCNTVYHAGESRWKSTVENRAADLRPELCPLGKYGYDPRCRPWYDEGMKLSKNGGSSLYVTAPYLFASPDGIVGQSCTSPLVDAMTNEHIGQTLVDFRATDIFDSLSLENAGLSPGGFPIMITLERDALNADTVIAGPNFSGINGSKPIEEVVFPLITKCGDDCGDLMNSFPEILASMRAGETGNGTFLLNNPDGSKEKVHLTYAPVNVISLRPLNSSDISRGVEKSEYPIYSLALVETDKSMLERFQTAEDEIDRHVRIAVAILATLIVLSACFVVYFSHRITISMVEPIYYLLELIKHINRLDVGEDPPGVYVYRGYGSKEILRVRWTMEKLYKIIQCANAAYFAGEVEVAYRVFTDALYLFTRLDNKKAMGVANNNLGNTMLTLYRTMKNTGETEACGFSVREIIGKGMAYFHKSIQLGEKAYDKFYETEGWSPSCLHFMQHLSNRYFNRAMFLLTVKDDHEKPSEIEELGMRDLEIARDMDVEIVDEGTQVGWGIRSSEEHFEVLLTRIRGHLTLLEMGYPDDWEVDEMLDQAFQLLKKELDGDSNSLFTDLSPAGRMQQIETQLMRYNVTRGDTSAAAKIAIRMLIEDEFTIPEAQEKAVEVLLRYVGTWKIKDAPAIKDRLESYKTWLQEACEELDTCRSSLQEQLDVDQLSAVFSSRSLHESVSEHVGASSRKSNAVSLRESLRGDITMEAF